MSLLQEFRESLDGALTRLDRHIITCEESLCFQSEESASFDSDECQKLRAIRADLGALHSNLKIAGDDIDNLPPLPREEVITQLKTAISSPAPSFMADSPMSSSEWLSLASNFRQYLILTENSA